MLRLLLPPSEGKTNPCRSAPLEQVAPRFLELEEPRRLVREALMLLCTTEPTRALSVLGLTANQTEEVVRNQELSRAPTAPAWQVYSGVLYRQLDAATLTALQREKLAQSVWIASALFGFVGFAERIPVYRLSGDTTLPGIGSLASFWREYLTPLLARESALILDLRSGSYTKLSPLPSSVAEQAIVPRVLQKMPTGPPKLITHFNKATKGRIVRAVAQHRGALRTADDLAQLIAQLGMEVTLLPATRAGQACRMDIVVEV